MAWGSVSVPTRLAPPRDRLAGSVARRAAQSPADKLCESESEGDWRPEEEAARKLSLHGSAGPDPSPRFSSARCNAERTFGLCSLEFQSKLCFFSPAGISEKAAVDPDPASVFALNCPAGRERETD